MPKPESRSDGTHPNPGSEEAEMGGSLGLLFSQSRDYGVL